MLSIKNRRNRHASTGEYDNDSNEPKLATIKGVQFGILSESEIKAMSAVEVTDTTIHKGGIVQRCGINAPHLGTMHPAMLCSTCGNSMDRCPGHSGHINLVEPIINIEFFTPLVKILTCVCFYCSKLLLPVDHPKYHIIMQIQNKKDRFEKIHDFCSKYRKCCSWSDHLKQKKKKAAEKGKRKARGGKNKGEQGAPGDDKRAEQSTENEEDLVYDLLGDNAMRPCGGIQPTYTKDDVTIRALFIVTREQLQNRPDSIEHVSPQNIHQTMKFINEDDIRALGLDPIHSRPSSMMWSALIVPPVPIRPSHAKSNSTKIGGEDDLTIRLRTIVKINQQLRAMTTPAGAPKKTSSNGDDTNEVIPTDGINLARYQFEGLIYRSVNDMIFGRPDGTAVVNDSTMNIVDVDPVVAVPVLSTGIPLSKNRFANKKIATRYGCYIELQKCVAGYQDAKYQKKSMDGSDYGREKKSIRNRISGPTSKRGRVRDNVLGKRTDFSGRTVITPDNYLKVDEVGVPISMCMKFTYPEVVSRLNIHKLTEMVRRGPTEYPGANYIERKAVGDTLSLQTGSNLKLKPGDRHNIKLEFGDIVKRHLVRGDWALFNRQPSLHKLSLMAHKIVPMPYFTFRLHLSCTTPYNADFDGDEMNLFIVLGPLTRAEAMILFAVEHNMVKDMRLQVGFREHAIIACFLLTRHNEWMTVERAQQLWMQNEYIDISRLPAPDLCHPKTGDLGYSGRAVFAACLPRGLEVAHGGTIIQNSVYANTEDNLQLNKSRVNDGVIYTIWKDMSPRAAIQFISGTQLLLEEYIRVTGLSIKAEDCFVEVPEEIKKKVRKGVAYADELSHHTPDLLGIHAEVTENNICLVLDKCRDVVGDHVMNQLRARPGRNGLLEMVGSGSKGNVTNVVQSVGMIGQQRNHLSRRMHETTSHFNCNEHIAAKHGMITRSFLRGMRPTEMYYHATASRGGLADTGVKTSEVGYCQRKIGKAMEENVVGADKAVRNARGDIIQFMYGDDGFDSVSVEHNRIHMLRKSELDTFVYHRCYPDAATSQLTPEAQSRWASQRDHYDWDEQVQRVLHSRYMLVSQLLHREFNDDCLSPVQFDRLLLRAQQRSSFPLDITPLETTDMVSTMWKKMYNEHVLVVHNMKLEALFLDRCSTSALWKHGKLNRLALTWFLEKIYHIFLTKSITPYDNVGITAEQNSAQPLVQMALSRFHQSGQFSSLVTGIARIKEILNSVRNPGMPSLTIFPRVGVDAEELGLSLLQVLATDVVQHWDSICPEPRRHDKFQSLWSKWKAVSSAPSSSVKQLVFHMNRTESIRRCVTPLMLANAFRFSSMQKTVQKRYSGDFNAHLSYASPDSDTWWVCFACYDTDAIWTNTVELLTKKNHARFLTNDMILMYLYEKFVNNQLVRGHRHIEDFYIETKTITEIVKDIPTPVLHKVIITKGSNLAAILAHDDILVDRTVSNFALETYNLLGIDAACACIENELRSVMAVNGAHVGVRHLKLLAKTMCFRGIVSPMTYQGICRQDTSVLKKAAFEKSMDSFILGAIQGHKDEVNTCTESIAWNKKLRCGTGAVTVLPLPTTTHKRKREEEKKYNEKEETKRRRLEADHKKDIAGRYIRYAPPNDLSHLLTPKTNLIFGQKRKFSSTLTAKAAEANSAIVNSNIASGITITTGATMVACAAPTVTVTIPPPPLKKTSKLRKDALSSSSCSPRLPTSVRFSLTASFTPSSPVLSSISPETAHTATLLVPPVPCPAPIPTPIPTPAPPAAPIISPSSPSVLFRSCFIPSSP